MRGVEREVEGEPSMAASFDVLVVEPDPRHRLRLGTHVPGATQVDSLDALVHALHPRRVSVAVLGPSLAAPLGFRHVQRLTAALPALGVVFAVEEVRTNVLQDAIRAGARDMVAIADGPALAQAVGRVGELLVGAGTSRPPSGADGRSDPGRLVVVFSTKGGVGKSVIAVNVSIAMTRLSSQPIALVDADLQFGDVAVMLGLPPEATIADAAAAVQLGDAVGVPELTTRHSSGVAVLPAPTDSSMGASVPPGELLAICDALRGTHGVVVVDTPTLFDATSLALLEAADEILLVGSLDIPSVKNLRIGMQALDLATIGGLKLRLVLNRANSQVKLDVREVEAVLGLRAEFPIPSDIAIPKSVNTGRSVFEEDPGSAAGRALEHIAASLLGLKTATSRGGRVLRRSRNRR